MTTVLTPISMVLFSAGLLLSASADPSQVCVPDWLLAILSAFAVMPTDVAVEVVKDKLGVET